MFCTVGCHPTRSTEFNSSLEYLNSLSNLITENKSKVIAVGECGLDYDRVEFCPIDTQKQYAHFKPTCPLFTLLIDVLNFKFN